MQIAWPATKAPTVAAQDALQRVSAMVAVAAGLAKMGRAIDLAGLDSAAGRLCAQVLDLPPDLGGGFRCALVELDASMTSLAAVLGRRPT